MKPGNPWRQEGAKFRSCEKLEDKGRALFMPLLLWEEIFLLSYKRIYFFN